VIKRGTVAVAKKTERNIEKDPTREIKEGGRDASENQSNPKDNGREIIWRSLFLNQDNIWYINAGFKHRPSRHASSWNVKEKEGVSSMDVGRVIGE